MCPSTWSIDGKPGTTVTISMHQSSVGVFTHFLGNLSDLLDHAAAHAEARKIDPSILLNARLYPNMYDLTRQVGEANRHAILACALLADADPPVFGDTEPDFAELKARIATARDFVGDIRPAQIDGAADKEVVFTFRNGSTRKFTGRSLAADFQRAAVLFSRHDGLRHLAPLRRRSRQKGFFGNAKFAGQAESLSVTSGKIDGARFRRRLCVPRRLRRRVRPFHS